MSQHDFTIPNDFDWCPDKPNPMQVYKLLVNDLSPTQFATGKTEVMYKSQRMKSKFNGKGKLHDYLLLRPVPVVKRGEQFYLVDQTSFEGAGKRFIHSSSQLALKNTINIPAFIS